MNYWINKNGIVYLNFDGKCPDCGDKLNLIKTYNYQSGSMSEDIYTCNRCYKEFVIVNWVYGYYQFAEYESNIVILENKYILVGYFINKYNIFNKIKNLFKEN